MRSIFRKDCLQPRNRVSTTFYKSRSSPQSPSGFYGRACAPWEKKKQLVVLVGWEAGEGSCPRLTNGCSGCTEPEQYFHSSVREKHWSNKRKHSHTHTDLSEINPGIKKKKGRPVFCPSGWRIVGGWKRRILSFKLIYGSERREEKHLFACWNFLIIALMVILWTLLKLWSFWHL